DTYLTDKCPRIADQTFCHFTMFIVPPAQDKAIVEQMLECYMGEMWQDEHRKMAKRLVGYPGAFIREVCVFAMTQAVDDDSVYEDNVHVSLALLEESFECLKTQIKARDALISQNPNGRDFGFAARANDISGD
ncbi:MAG: hypothetical protein AAFV93_20930, partial [Chloroflexota bacterium]